MNLAPDADPDPEGTPASPTAGQPAAGARGIAYGLLWLAIPFAVLVLWAMAASSAAATGGCGGG